MQFRMGASNQNQRTRRKEDEKDSYSKTTYEPDWTAQFFDECRE
jgi:hypothetical protein